MKIIFFVTVIIQCLFGFANGAIDCYHNLGYNDKSYQSYCIYAQLENGTDLQMCDYEHYDRYGLEEWPQSEMFECVKAPGYLKFMRCDTDLCNTGCEIIEPTTLTTTEQASTTSVASTTLPPTTVVEPSTTTKGPISPGKNNDTACGNSTNPDGKNGYNFQLPLTNVFGNKQVNVVYNIPATSNNCECRCNQNKAQNNFIVQ
uniref:Chitin-binding type-2 domain-containing protein n=1 Tax=Panagrellus redivivus TaxID=6233 RepID=A0A7E4V813_PANRE